MGNTFLYIDVENMGSSAAHKKALELINLYSPIQNELVSHINVPSRFITDSVDWIITKSKGGKNSSDIVIANKIYDLVENNLSKIDRIILFTSDQDFAYICSYILDHNIVLLLVTAKGHEILIEKIYSKNKESHLRLENLNLKPKSSKKKKVHLGNLKVTPKSKCNTYVYFKKKW